MAVLFSFSAWGISDGRGFYPCSGCWPLYPLGRSNVGWARLLCPRSLVSTDLSGNPYFILLIHPLYTNEKYSLEIGIERWYLQGFYGVLELAFVSSGAEVTKGHKCPRGYTLA